MKPLTIATVVAMIALLPAYSDAMSGRRHRESGTGPVASNEGYAPGYAGGSYNSTVSVPEPGSFVLVASGLTTLGGLLARRWYVMKKREKRDAQ
jgi:hypothetical protein